LIDECCDFQRAGSVPADENAGGGFGMSAMDFPDQSDAIHFGKCKVEKYQIGVRIQGAECLNSGACKNGLEGVHLKELSQQFPPRGIAVHDEKFFSGWIHGDELYAPKFFFAVGIPDFFKERDGRKSGKPPLLRAKIDMVLKE
jgi:hypothetical protein